MESIAVSSCAGNGQKQICISIGSHQRIPTGLFQHPNFFLHLLIKRLYLIKLCRHKISLERGKNSLEKKHSEQRRQNHKWKQYSFQLNLNQ